MFDDVTEFSRDKWIHLAILAAPCPDLKKPSHEKSMLPDFPKTKALIGKRYLKRFHDTHSQVLGPFMDMPQSPVHEGHRFGLVREDGKLDEMEWKMIKASETIKLDEVENWTDEQIYAHYERMAKQMAFQQKKMTFEEINKAVKGVGNEISLNGPPSAEGILQTYERMWVEFQDDGTHVPLTLVCSPEAQPHFARAFQELESDPEMRKRFEELMQRKRNEWRERESARKLVG